METISGHDTARLWQEALSELQIQLAREDFHAWFQEAELVSYDGSTCLVGHANPMVLPWLENRCGGLLSRTFTGLLGAPVSVQFTARSPRLPESPPPPLELDPPPASRNGRRSRQGQAAPRALRPTNSRFTFDNFVVGGGNRLAHAACVAAAERPGKAHNPLFLYGGVGLGKTHLLHAIGHRALQDDLDVVYVSSETFKNEFVESWTNDRNPDFRAKYRRADVLLVDDVQFIAGRDGTEEQLVHAFNSVYEGGGQIVVSSDRAPRAIATLAQRLQSRFAWGLMADIQAPDLATRTAILQRKLGQRGLDHPEFQEVLAYIAERVSTNVRELEGALNCVLGQADLLGCPVSAELAKTALATAFPVHESRTSDPDAIIKNVCRVTGVTRRSLESKVRDRRTASARHLAMYLLREQTSLALADIGTLLGGRDHSTVLHAHAKIAEALPRDESLRQALAAIREQLERL